MIVVMHANTVWKSLFFNSKQEALDKIVKIFPEKKFIVSGDILTCSVYGAKFRIQELTRSSE